MKTFGHKSERIESTKSETQNTIDSKLIARIASQRDAQAFTTLCSTYSKSAFNLAFYITGNKSLGEEAVQDAMFDLWQSASKFKPGRVKGWILKIVARRSLKKFNRNIQIKTREKAQDDSVAMDLCRFDEITEKQELMAALHSELEALPPQDKQLVGLFYSGAYTQDEIAKVIQIPQSTVSFRLRKTLERLKQNLSKAGYSSVGLAGLSESTIPYVILNAHDTPPEWFCEMLASTKSRLDRLEKDPQENTGKIPSSFSLSFHIVATISGCFAVAFVGLMLARSTPELKIETSTGLTLPKRTMHQSFNATNPIKDWNAKMTYTPTRGVDNSGAIILPKHKFNWICNLPRWRFPLKVTCQYRPFYKEATEWGLSLAWHAPKYICSFNHFSNVKNVVFPKHQPWQSFTGYVTETHIDLWDENRRITLVFCEPGNSDHQLLLCHSGAMIIDNLTVTEISEAEVPDISDFRDVFEGMKKDKTIRDGCVNTYLDPPTLRKHVESGQKMTYQYASEKYFKRTGLKVFERP